MTMSPAVRIEHGVPRPAHQVACALADERLGELLARGRGLDGLAVAAVHRDHVAVRRDREPQRVVEETAG
jgi:hypothetical protein